MKIRILPVGDRTLDALLQRVYEQAGARGIAREEAVREALRLWLARTGVEAGEAVLEATESEYAAVRQILAVMRGYGK